MNESNSALKPKMPSGIPYIIGNEAAERFSYYGMKAILVVFMTQYLQMAESTATDWLHTFTIGVYATPLIGAIVCDLFFGKYKTIMSLSIVYCLGHLVLALYETQEGLAIGLTLIAIGSGGIKPCVSAHVGDQFDASNASLIERVYSYFYLSINLGAFISTLATPFLLQKFGPSVAFGVPGLLMFIATFLFWLGRNKFIAIKADPEKLKDDLRNPKTWKAIGSLIVVYFFVAFFWSLFDQTASTWVIQALPDLMVKDFDILGYQFTVLPSQVQAFNPLFILLFTPLFTFLVYPMVGKVVKLTAMRKITVGMFITAISFAIIGYVEGQLQTGQSMHISWQVFAYAVITAAEVMVSITALEFSYTQAPNSMKSIIMGFYLLSVSGGNVITKYVNKAIIQDVEVVALESGPNTIVELPAEFVGGREMSFGEKIEFKGENGLQLTGEKEGPLSGTFLIGESAGDNRFELLDINRNSLATRGEMQLEASAGVNMFKIRGATYFYFFTALMLAAALLFIIVAVFYKEETYIQPEDARE